MKVRMAVFLTAAAGALVTRGKVGMAENSAPQAQTETHMAGGEPNLIKNDAFDEFDADGRLQGWRTAVDIVNSASWKKQFGQTFRVFSFWRRYEQVFQAPGNLPAASSRSAFYMKGTGVLFVADVSRVATVAPDIRQPGMQWWPQIV